MDRGLKMNQIAAGAVYRLGIGGGNGLARRMHNER